jgi:uncharacterized protein YkwD
MTIACTAPKPSIHRITALAAPWLLLALAACGGGGGDDDAAAAAAAPTPPADVVVPPVVPAASAAASTCSLPDFAASALTRINQHRAAGAICGTRGSFATVPALAWSEKLTQAADGHSQDMAAQNYFSHTSADGRTVGNRIEATGYLWNTYGENIAAGYPTVNAVIDGWMASDGHCANMMAPSFTEVGLACVAGTSTSTYNTYWTMDLARPR